MRPDILEMFAEFSGESRLADALEAYSSKRRANATERTRLWRADNPKKYRALRRRCKRNYRRRHSDKVNAAQLRARARNLAKHRDRDKRNAKAYRDRQKASK